MSIEFFRSSSICWYCAQPCGRHEPLFHRTGRLTGRVRRVFGGSGMGVVWVLGVMRAKAITSVPLLSSCGCCSAPLPIVAGTTRGTVLHTNSASRFQVTFPSSVNRLAPQSLEDLMKEDTVAAAQFLRLEGPLVPGAAQQDPRLLGQGDNGRRNSPAAARTRVVAARVDHQELAADARVVQLGDQPVLARDLEQGLGELDPRGLGPLARLDRRIGVEGQ